MIHLREVALREPESRAEFPFTVPALQALIGSAVAFPTPVTLFVGENGSGKSTLLEGIAAAVGSITAGTVAAAEDRSLTPIEPLVRALRPTWNRRTRRGFFLRSEDFFGYARKMHQVPADLEAERQAILDDPARTAEAKGFAAMPYGREIADMERRHGAGLDARSHGEAFLTLFGDRLVPNGLFLLDEPEAPLSPMRQLALLSLIRETVEERTPSSSSRRTRRS